MMIREPTAADVRDLGALHANAWQAAYRGQMPAAFLDQVTVERRTALWTRLTGTATGEREHIRVADVDGAVVGFVHVGPCRDEDAPEGLGELYGINVAPEAWGSGAGRQLLAAGHGALAAGGFERAVLWVLPGNVRARRFYERGGWTADGAQREIQVTGGVIPEVRYAIDLR
jgi:RimJ/RimL family protein N-acetyltransferase